MATHLRPEKGFTLVEVVAAMAIGLIMLGAIYAVIDMAQKSTTGIERKVVAQQDARMGMEIMAMEIRMASYDPNLNTGIWVNPSTCTAGTPTARGIREASPSTLTVEMDVTGATDASGNCSTATNGNGAIDGCNEIIRYVYLSGDTDQRITRGTVSCPGATTGGQQPFLGAPAGGTDPRTVRVINASLNIPVFRYYNGSGTEIFPTTVDQSTVPDIRRIDITLAVETEDIDPGTKQRRRLIYATSVMPKNHAITVITPTP